MRGTGHQHMNKAAHVTVRKRRKTFNMWVGSYSPLPQNAPSSSCSVECVVFKRQHSGISERNLSADFPYMSVSLIERRWLSITWLHGRRYLRTPPTQIHKSMDKNETHCHNGWNQWMFSIHNIRTYSNLRCMDTWEWAATWHLHSSGTVESGRGSTIPYRAVTHRDEYW